MSLQEKLRNLRKEKNMSLKEAAERSKLSVVSLCKYENGISTPSAISLAKLAETYGADYDELFKLRKE